MTDEHSGYCGPARGFRVCYCRCPECRSPADKNGNTTCVCAGCQNPGCPVHDPRRKK